MFSCSFFWKLYNLNGSNHLMNIHYPTCRQGWREGDAAARHRQSEGSVGRHEAAGRCQRQCGRSSQCGGRGQRSRYRIRGNYTLVSDSYWIYYINQLLHQSISGYLAMLNFHLRKGVGYDSSCFVGGSSWCIYECWPVVENGAAEWKSGPAKQWPGCATQPNWCTFKKRLTWHTGLALS